ncbi:MAG: RluA family pseudouridine synthase [Candidatus Aminicenantes bacterium]|nr:RluA family pseudouridine synthase [Candidatus Aminicenantes bacterium]
MPPQSDLSAGPRDAGLRLDVFLARNVRVLTRSRLKGLIDSGRVSVNGRAAKPGQKLKTGDNVKMEWDEDARPGLRPELMPLEVLFADEHLAVIVKPSGLVVHPGAGHRSGTLASGLLARFPGIESVGAEERPGIVHRLDKETSGVMVVARSEEACFALQRMFRNRKVRKTYLGLVWGRMKRPEGKLDRAIGRSLRGGAAFAVQGRKPREALTLYKVLRVFKEHSLLQIRPVTGRTHQIRVHFAAAGHPLAGDTRYGRRRGDKAFPRLFLHAWRLEFPHPVTGREMEFSAPLPVELEEALGLLGSGEGA